MIALSFQRVGQVVWGSRGILFFPSTILELVFLQPSLPLPS